MRIFSRCSSNEDRRALTSEEPPLIVAAILLLILHPSTRESKMMRAAGRAPQADASSAPIGESRSIRSFTACRRRGVQSGDKIVVARRRRCDGWRTLRVARIPARQGALFPLPALFTIVLLLATEANAASALSVRAYSATVPLGEPFSVELAVSLINMPQCPDAHEPRPEEPCFAVVWKFIRAGVRPNPVHTVSNLSGWERPADIRPLAGAMSALRLRIRAPGRGDPWVARYRDGDRAISMGERGVRHPSHHSWPAIASRAMSLREDPHAAHFYVGVLAGAACVVIWTLRRRGATLDGAPPGSCSPRRLRDRREDLS